MNKQFLIVSALATAIFLHAGFALAATDPSPTQKKMCRHKTAIKSMAAD